MCRPPDTGQVQAGRCLLLGQSHRAGQGFPYTVRADLVDLVCCPDDRERIGDAESFVEALEDFPVVDVDRPLRQVQAGQDLMDDPRQLGIVVQRDLIGVDHVDVTLGEFPVAALLRALTAPDPLNLVPLEREDQIVEVLGDIARKGHREVKVQA